MKALLTDPLARGYAITTVALALLIGLVAVAWAPHYEPLWAWINGR